jgi:hypothetical protein
MQLFSVRNHTPHNRSPTRDAHPNAQMKHEASARTMVGDDLAEPAQVELLQAGQGVGQGDESGATCLRPRQVEHA